ncbi:MAG TPA: FoF1 ATP synthase subunit gamma [Terracidiphilus sp.]|nr:FoF1 ATP synthase subunit gamma [Terracidiphilus sp.]
MANVLDLRRRIRSVKNTRQITKAMKMVSAAKLRRAQERAIAARPYARMIVSVLESLRRRVDLFDEKSGNLCSPLFVTRPEKRVLVVVVSGDKGFAGAFNANILKTGYQFINGNPDKEIDIEAIGRKGRDQLRRRYPAAVYTEQTNEHGVKRQVRGARQGPVEVTGDHPGLLVKLEPARVEGLAHVIVSRYVHEEIDSAYIVYNEFKSVIAQRVVVERILPLIDLENPQITGAVEPSAEEKERVAEAALSAGIELEAADTTEADEEAKKFGTAEVDYIYEQPAEELFKSLLPQYIFSVLFHAMTESVAAEHAARMTAMDSATNNASDMIDALTLYMNRVRQAAITKEIIEIVSGAAAL